MESRARPRGDGQIRLDRVAARFRRERPECGVEEYRVAFRWSEHESDPRRRGDRVVLDLERRNGALLVGRHQVLIVDGRTAVSAPATVPEYRRVWTMIEDGHPTWATDPTGVERGVICGRPVETLSWDHSEGSAVLSYDVATGLCVAVRTPSESIELTDLQFDDDVDDGWFAVPAPVEDWKGGSAFVMHDVDSQGLHSVSWQPASGPGRLHIDGPSGVPLDEALAWARSRSEHVTVGDVDGRERER